LVKPYTNGSSGLRTILCETAGKEHEWHRDREDRTITILSGQGWQLQYNGQLPVELIEGQDYYIPKMMYHRVIQGVNDLKIRINENI
jgi:quercetin dioxygenase-like cupin family protein